MQQKNKSQSTQQASLKNNFITLQQQSQVCRKSKKNKTIPSSATSNPKTQEQTIGQAYQELNKYILSMQNRIKGIVQGYQIQFLNAYRQYMKKTKIQMQQIKKMAANNSNSDRNYLQKIEVLEKQLIIFREQSLKLFNNVFKKEQELNNKGLEIQILRKQNKDYEQKLYSLMKKNKQLQVQLATMKNQNQNKNSNLDKRSSSSSPYKFFQIDRGLSTTLKNKLEENLAYNKTAFLRIGKASNFMRSKTNKDEQKSVHSINNDRIKHQLDDNDTNRFNTCEAVTEKQSRQKLSNFRKMSANIIKKKQKSVNRQLVKNASQFAERNCLIHIFWQAVEKIQQDNLRRKNIPNLKMFRADGPQNYDEFKKIDSYALFELLFTNEVMLQQIFNLIFNQK